MQACLIQEGLKWSTSDYICNQFPGDVMLQVPQGRVLE